MTWGKDGSGPGEFRRRVHAIAIDERAALYVADRGNSRIQVFDENGKHLDPWPNIRTPYTLRVSADDHLWVFSGPLDRMLKYDLNGNSSTGGARTVWRQGFSGPARVLRRLRGESLYRGGLRRASAEVPPALGRRSFEYFPGPAAHAEGDELRRTS